ncbi:unnamed protein product [Triticum turgidum subsp. durum]|uniref:Uncharacterized protein n=1 Tax=Triticum turgidum subsp. durum TaxID=4567 RepID=A0A9R0V275_TRITD|nr:unnamed protein product [Triticum turgidum subsp. durum]
MEVEVELEVEVEVSGRGEGGGGGRRRRRRWRWRAEAKVEDDRSGIQILNEGYSGQLSRFHLVGTEAPTTYISERREYMPYHETRYPLGLPHPIYNKQLLMLYHKHTLMLPTQVGKI